MIRDFRTGASLVLLAVILFTAACQKHVREGVVAERPTPIASDWVTVTPPRPLVATKGRFQHLDMTVSNDLLASNDQFGLQLPNGAVVIPEVQLLDSQNNAYPLDEVGISGRQLMFSGETLLGSVGTRKFARVQIRCQQPVTVSSITWFDSPR
ncbi:MAG TPA: hypothetical protein VEG30_18460 [Terriglobales bacterium]|nr:hypothetical protein [Terriglobales bacterium]